jgi:hypothetical protein
MALPTLNPHPPQFHRIETWLSYTSLIPKYPLHLALYVITSHLPKDDLFPLLWTPFTLCFRHRTIAYPLETCYGTFLLFSRCFLKFQFERYFLPHSLSYPPDNRPCKGPFSRRYPLLRLLNLGTRFLVVEENCNTPRIILQWPPPKWWSCHHDH